tara:strand:+ start:45 stop:269 length:225 start_codon:yes stop_codon:yes gene_type:complete
MIIPIKCFTCGKVLADKWLYYKKEVEKNINAEDKINIYLDKNKNEKSIQGKVLDDLNLKKICCRRHMLTHVDIE